MIAASTACRDLCVRASSDSHGLTVRRCTMEARHTVEVHSARLNSICRVCGRRSRSKSLSSKSTALVSSELQVYLNIDRSSEQKDAHSQTVCIKCYAKLKKLPARPSETCVQNFTRQVERSAHMWGQFDPSLSTSSCPVCSTFLLQTRGGRPRKQRSHGVTLSKKQDTNSSDISLPDQPSELPSASTPTTFCSSGLTDGIDAMESPSFPTIFCSSGLTDATDAMESPSIPTTFCSSDPTGAVRSPSIPTAFCSSGPTDATDAVESPPSSEKRPKADHTNMQTSPRARLCADFEACPALPLPLALRPVTELSSPLTAEEEEYLTVMVTLKLRASEDNRTLRCETKGRPLVMERVDLA